jgi:MOSC domain-containing protein YiiM
MARLKRRNTRTVCVIASGESSPLLNTPSPRRVTSRSSWISFSRPACRREIFRRTEFDPMSMAAKVGIVHGGPDKAVYAYPVEHYEYWRMQVPEMPATLGAFGENLTTRGVLEKDLHIGDQVRVGSALLQVSQPRMPCYKLQVRFDREDMTKLFALSRRSGFYLSVIEEGKVKAGDAIEVVERDKHRVSIADVNGLYFDRPIDRELAKRALQVPALTAESRSMVLSRLAQVDSS